MALKQASFSAVWQALVRQSFYPPGHSLLVALAYLIAGPSLAASRLPSVLAFAGYAIMLARVTAAFLKTCPLTGSGGRLNLPLSGALIAAVLAWASPLSIFNAERCMIEAWGLLLLTGLLFAVHPVAAASAAWISELKNVLAMEVS